MKDAASPPRAHAEAKARIAAARLCSGAQYLAGCGILLYAIGWLLPILSFVQIAGVIAALAAFPLAAFGLWRLRRLGPGRPLTSDISGLERVGLRMGRRAKRQGVHGLLWSGVLLGYAGLVFGMAWQAHAHEQRQREERARQWSEEEAELLRRFIEATRAEQGAADDNGRWDGPGTAQTPDLAAINALHDIGKHMAYPGYVPEEPLPAATLARRFEAVLEEYAGTRAARLVIEGRDQPYREMKRILEAHGWAPPEGSDD